MTTTTRTRAKPEQEPLVKVQAQLDDLREKLLKARSRLAEIAFEIDALTSSPDARGQQLDALRERLRKTERQREEIEEYAALVAGASASQELEILRLKIEEILQQIEAAESAHTAESKERAAREMELRAEQGKIQKTVADLDARLSTSYAVKERLQMERGAAILKECEALLTDAEGLEQEYTERLEQAKRVAVVARRDAEQRLEQYPSLRRELASRHRLMDDATSTGLQAFLDLLDALLECGGPAIEYAAAGQPSGSVSILSEMELDATLLRAFAAGDYYLARVRRDRVDGLLRDYRAKQARV